MAHAAGKLNVWVQKLKCVVKALLLECIGFVVTKAKGFEMATTGLAPTSSWLDPQNKSQDDESSQITYTFRTNPFDYGGEVPPPARTGSWAHRWV